MLMVGEGGNEALISLYCIQERRWPFLKREGDRESKSRISKIESLVVSHREKRLLPETLC